MMIRSAIPLLILCLSSLVGCTDPGPKRFRISGEAKFDNQPIVHGDILFTPDGANAGAQGIAQIRDGTFDTEAPDGKGFGGGPTVVRITGFTREGGKLLCETEIRVDLPRGDTIQQFNIPKKDGIQAKPGPEI